MLFPAGINSESIVSMVRIPRSALSRRERTYALLVRGIRLHPFPSFTGRFFRCGADIEDADLTPASFPQIPLLIEFAGNDRTGRGHDRSRDIHILWRLSESTGEWQEIARVLSHGPEWFHHLAPIVRRLLSATEPDFIAIAAAVSGRVLGLLDQELALLEDEARKRVLSFLWDQFAARLVA